MGHLVMSVLRDCMHVLFASTSDVLVPRPVAYQRGKDERTLNSVPGADVVGGTCVVTAVLHRRVLCGVLDKQVLCWIFFSFLF